MEGDRRKSEIQKVCSILRDEKIKRNKANVYKFDKLLHSVTAVMRHRNKKSGRTQ